MEWICIGKLLTVFEANRVHKIESHSAVTFRYDPTNNNQEDTITSESTVKS